MKKENSKISHALLALFSLASINQVIAGDLIRRDDPGPATCPGLNATYSTSSIAIESTITTEITTTQTATELIVDFNSAVGMAYVSFVNEDGFVVYQTMVDTFIDSQVIIPLDGLDTGNYYLNVSYGSTNYIEAFNL